MAECIFDLSGQVAIVTGGGTGIGRAISIELARAGADIVICSRDPNHLEATALEIQGIGKKCLISATDIRKPDQIERTIQRAFSELGRIDILVNNAGANFLVPAEKMSLNAWNVILNVNLTGTFLFCQAVFPVMLKQKGGNIINISSVAGREGHPFAARYSVAAPHYGAAKAGVINLTKTLASGWGRYNIRVNCVTPGAIITAGSRSSDTKDVLAFENGLCRAGQPEEVAHAVLFLSSRGASYISGAVLDVDGAMS
jgi:NAD(P)-dependent dehydrogenase (short-subunit alcohol dehydrogenase family)